MTEYRLSIHSLPQICFAHKYSTECYNITHDRRCNFVEIFYISTEGSTIVTTLPDGTETVESIPQNSVIVTLYENPRHYSASGFHAHTTVGFTMEWSYAEKDAFVLPRILTFDSPENPVHALLDDLVLQYSIDSSAPLNSAILWKLLSELSIRHLTQKQQSALSEQAIYVQKAKKYIMEHLSAPIPVADIAAHLNISCSYLSHLFTRIQGQTLITYINTLKLQRIEELVLLYDMDLHTAGRQVGLNDPNYICRLFRKLRGYSLSDYRRSIRR